MSAVYYVVATIEGAINQWTTSVYGGGGGTHGRTIRRGLQHGGIVVQERTDIRGGLCEGDTITLQIIATPEANDEFTRAPRLLTNLASSVTTAATTSVVVRSKELLNNGDYIHVGTECMEVTDASTTTLVVGRGKRGTTAQIHLIADGANAQEVPAWSKVYAFEGRRVTIEVYENAATSTAFRGIISQAPYLNDAGTMWLIDVDPITKLLDQTVGNPSDGEGRITGIKLGTSSALGFTNGITDEFSLVGFYEYEQELITAVNALVTPLTISGIASQWVDIGENEFGARVMRLWLTVSAGDQIDAPTIEFGSTVLGFVRLGLVQGWPSLPRTPFRQVLSSGAIYTRPIRQDVMDAGTAYVCEFFQADSIATQRGYGFPCGLVWARRRPEDPFYNEDGESVDETKDLTIALDGAVTAAVGDTLFVRWEPGADPLALVISHDLGANVYGFANAGIVLQAYADENGIDQIVFTESTRVEVRPALGSGTLSSFVTAMLAAAPSANLGAVPYLAAADIDASTTAVAARVSEISSLGSRNFNITEAAKLSDIISQELLLLGMLMRVNTSGAIEFKEFGLPSQTTVVSVTFDSSDVVTPFGDAGMFPGWKPATDGIVSVVEVSPGAIFVPEQRRVRLTNGGRRRYVSIAATTRDPESYIYRDVASVSAHKNRGTGTLSIQPVALSTVDLTLDDAIAIGSRLCAFFGRPYEVVTFQVRRTSESLGVRCGDVIGLTNPHVPNSGDGTRGVTARRCTVIGRRVSYDPADRGAVVEFVVIMHSAASNSINVAGYTPTCAITAAALVSGDIWDCTVSASYLVPSGSYSTDFLTVDDNVEAMQVDDSTPNTQTGVVVSKTATNVRVSFDSTAPWGGAFSGSYVLKFAAASAGVTTAQAVYAYTSDTTMLLSDGNPARVFA